MHSPGDIARGREVLSWLVAHTRKQSLSFLCCVILFLIFFVSCTSLISAHLAKNLKSFSCLSHPHLVPILLLLNLTYYFSKTSDFNYGIVKRITVEILEVRGRSTGTQCVIVERFVPKPRALIC